jgi:hypothetical protein
MVQASAWQQSQADLPGPAAVTVRHTSYTTVRDTIPSPGYSSSRVDG